MKNKKIFIIIYIAVFLILAGFISLVLLGGNGKSPVSLTNIYMKKYQKLDKKTVSNIKYAFSDELTPTQEEKYQNIIKKQYEKITYQITNKQITESDALITVEFSVYDLASTMEKANNYIEVYSDKFQKNGEFDTYKAIDYKLKALQEADERVTYSIVFTYYKDKNTWKLIELSDTDLQKLNGTY